MSIGGLLVDPIPIFRSHPIPACINSWQSIIIYLPLSLIIEKCRRSSSSTSFSVIVLVNLILFLNCPRSGFFNWAISMVFGIKTLSPFLRTSRPNNTTTFFKFDAILCVVESELVCLLGSGSSLLDTSSSTCRKRSILLLQIKI